MWLLLTGGPSGGFAGRFLKRMTILNDILGHKREEVASAKRTTPLERLRLMPGYARPTRSLRAALSAQGPVVIADV